MIWIFDVFFQEIFFLFFYLNEKKLKLFFFNFNVIWNLIPLFLFFRVYLSCASKSSELNMTIESISRHHTYWCALVLLVIISANLVQSVFVESLQRPCNGKKTCHECIQTKGCAWCAQPDFGERCFQNNTSPLTGSCAEPFIFSPINEQQIKKALVLTSLRNGSRVNESHGGGGQYEEGQYQVNSNKGYHSRSGFEQESSRQTGHIGVSDSHFQTSQSVSYESYEESGKIVQIFPQRIGLKLRISMFYWQYMYELNALEIVNLTQNFVIFHCRRST